jgi:hypothetical protein
MKPHAHLMNAVRSESPRIEMAMILLAVGGVEVRMNELQDLETERVLLGSQVEEGFQVSNGLLGHVN